MEAWLEQIAHILLHPEYPQIKGQLQRLDDEGEIIGKCALGEIRCQAGASNVHGITDPEGLIMKACGVPADLRIGRILPCITSVHDNVIVNMVLEKNEFDWNYDNVQSWIYKLNDAGYEYEQIVEFLETTFEA